jgi:hypothetical protein
MGLLAPYIDSTDAKVAAPPARVMHDVLCTLMEAIDDVRAAPDQEMVCRRADTPPI